MAMRPHIFLGDRFYRLVGWHKCFDRNVAPTVVGTYSRPRFGADPAVRIMGSKLRTGQF